jgi:polar amino acid transport system permease protein
MHTFQSVTLNLLDGFGTTCLIFILTLVFAMPLGLLVSFGSMNSWKPLHRLIHTEAGWARFLKAFRPISFVVRVFVWIIRGTPLMLQLVIVFYGPGLLWGGTMFDRFEATIVAFTINYACYFSEIFRGGIQGVPRGQQEAGLVLGMTKRQIFFRVTLLQVTKRIIPPMSNEIITLVKDTSLARIIAVTEIIYFGQRYATSSALLWPLFYTGVFFLAFCGVLTLLFGFIERKLDYFKV